LSLKFLVTKAEVTDQKLDALILEIIILVLEFLNSMVQFVSTHQKIKELEVMSSLIKLLKSNQNAIVVKYTCISLHQMSNYPIFYSKHLAHPDSLNEILRTIILNPGNIDQISLLHMQECLRIMINNGGAEVRYSIASIGMKVTASYF
jgi:hypothetical protein